MGCNWMWVMEVPVLQCSPSLVYLSANFWKPHGKKLKIHYREERCFVKNQSRDGLLLGWGLWGSAIPAPVVSPPMLLALYSVLMIMYCMQLALYGVYGFGLWRSPYCNVPPAWCTWALTFASLTAKRWKSTIEKKGASSRIDPGMACTSGGGTVGLRHPSTPMLLALYSVLMIMYTFGLVWGVIGCGLWRSPYCNVPPA